MGLRFGPPSLSPFCSSSAAVSSCVPPGSSMATSAPASPRGPLSLETVSPEIFGEAGCGPGCSRFHNQLLEPKTGSADLGFGSDLKRGNAVVFKSGSSPVVGYANLGSTEGPVAGIWKGYLCFFPGASEDPGKEISH